MKKKAIISLFCYFDLFPAIKKNFEEYEKILIMGEDLIIEGYENFSKNVFNKIIVVKNLNDFKELENVILNLEKDYDIQHIFSRFEKYIEIGSKIKKRFGFYDSDKENSKIMRNKFLMRNFFEKKNFKVPKYHLIETQEEIKDIFLKEKTKLVLKPIDGFGSEKTHLIESKKDINKIESFNNERKILEEYIPGKEYRLDFIVANNKLCSLLVGEYLEKPIFTIKSKKGRRCIYYNKNTEFYQKMSSYVEKIIESSDIENGVFHLEVYRTKMDEIIFGEIAIRLGGGYLDKIYKNYFNIDISDVILKNEIGDLELFNVKEYAGYIGVIYFPYINGKIKKISTEENFKNFNSIKEIKFLNKKGDFLKARDDSMKRTGYCILESKSKRDLENLMNEVLEKFEIEVI